MASSEFGLKSEPTDPDFSDSKAQGGVTWEVISETLITPLVNTSSLASSAGVRQRESPLSVDKTAQLVQIKQEPGDYESENLRFRSVVGRASLASTTCELQNSSATIPAAVIREPLNSSHDFFVKTEQSCTCGTADGSTQQHSLLFRESCSHSLKIKQEPADFGFDSSPLRSVAGTVATGVNSHLKSVAGTVATGVNSHLKSVAGTVATGVNSHLKSVAGTVVSGSQHTSTSSVSNDSSLGKNTLQTVTVKDGHIWSDSSVGTDGSDACHDTPCLRIADVRSGEDQVQAMLAGEIPQLTSPSSESVKRKSAHEASVAKRRKQTLVANVIEDKVVQNSRICKEGTASDVSKTQQDPKEGASEVQNLLHPEQRKVEEKNFVNCPWLFESQCCKVAPESKSASLVYPTCSCNHSNAEQSSLIIANYLAGRVSFLHFMNRQLLAFHKGSVPYVSVLELDEADLMPAQCHVIQAVVNLGQDQIRGAHSYERNVLQAMFPLAPDVPYWKSLLTPHALHVVYREASARDPNLAVKYAPHLNSLFYLQHFNHRCWWSLLVTPSCDRRLPAALNGRKDHQPVTKPRILASRRKVSALKSKSTDMNSSAQDALGTLIGQLGLRDHVDRYCECRLTTAQLAQRKADGEGSGVQPHVYELLFQGQFLHCWIRPNGIFVSVEELQTRGLLNKKATLVDRILGMAKAWEDLTQLSLLEMDTLKRLDIKDWRRINICLINLKCLRLIFRTLGRNDAVFGSHAKAMFFLRLMKHECSDANINPLIKDGMLDVVPDAKDNRVAKCSAAPNRRDDGVAKSTAVPDVKDIRVANSTAVPDVKDNRVANSTAVPNRRDDRVAKSTAVPIRRDDRVAKSTAVPDRKDNRVAKSTAVPDGKDGKKTTVLVIDKSTKKSWRLRCAGSDSLVAQTVLNASHPGAAGDSVQAVKDGISDALNQTATAVGTKTNVENKTGSGSLATVKRVCHSHSKAEAKQKAGSEPAAGTSAPQSANTSSWAATLLAANAIQLSGSSSEKGEKPNQLIEQMKLAIKNEGVNINQKTSFRFEDFPLACQCEPEPSPFQRWSFHSCVPIKKRNECITVDENFGKAILLPQSLGLVVCTIQRRGTCYFSYGELLNKRFFLHDVFPCKFVDPPEYWVAPACETDMRILRRHGVNLHVNYKFQRLISAELLCHLSQVAGRYLDQYGIYLMRAGHYCPDVSSVAHSFFPPRLDVLQALDKAAAGSSMQTRTLPSALKSVVRESRIDLGGTVKDKLVEGPEAADSASVECVGPSAVDLQLRDNYAIALRAIRTTPVKTKDEEGAVLKRHEFFKCRTFSQDNRDSLSLMMAVIKEQDKVFKTKAAGKAAKADTSDRFKRKSEKAADDKFNRQLVFEGKFITEDEAATEEVHEEVIMAALGDVADQYWVVLTGTVHFEGEDAHVALRVGEDIYINWTSVATLLTELGNPGLAYQNACNISADAFVLPEPLKVHLSSKGMFQDNPWVSTRTLRAAYWYGLALSEENLYPRTYSRLKAVFIDQVPVCKFEDFVLISRNI